MKAFIRRHILVLFLLVVVAIPVLFGDPTVWHLLSLTWFQMKKSPGSFLLAISCFLTGHYFRIKNARKLISTVVQKAPWHPIVRSISIGYLFNTVCPYKVGEIVRVLVLAEEMKIGRGTVLLTVIFERIFDCVILSSAVLALLWCSALFTANYTLAVHLSVLPLILLSVGLTLFAILLVIYGQSNLLLKFWNKISSILNSNLRDQSRFRIWSAIHGIHTLVRKANLKTYLANASIMWSFYLLGTWVLTLPHGRQFFLQFVIAALAQISSSMQLKALSFDSSFEALIREQTPLISIDSLIILPKLILVLQLAPICVLGAFFVFIGSRKSALQLTKYSGDPRFNKLQRHVNIANHFSGFLSEYFSGTELFKEISQAELKQDFHLLRTFKGGSNAITLLAADKAGVPFVRKVTLNKYAEKLKAQCEWVRNYSMHPEIPQVQGEDINSNCYSYDVRFYPEAKTFFDFIHSNPLSSSQLILDGVIKFLIQNIYQPRVLVNSPETVRSYINVKVLEKLSEAAAANPSLAQLIDSEVVFVNGVECKNIKSIVKTILEIPEVLADLANYEESPIHGDLTVDNILIDQDRFILLDPNNENHISSLAVDFAKLYQSLHSGYEFLVKLESSNTNMNSITFEENVSNKYHDLFKYLDTRLQEMLPVRVYRSLLFHEAVHFCRMLTYRVNIDPRTVTAFYGVAVRLFNEYIKQYKSQDIFTGMKEGVDAKVANINAVGRTR